MINAVLLGGALHGQTGSVGPHVTLIDTPQGRYVRTAQTSNVSVFSLIAPDVPKIPPPVVVANQWARKVKTNPFPSGHR